MELIVRNGEREERVQIRRNDRNGGGYEVVIGGRTYHVDASPPRPGLTSLRIDGAQHEVAVRREGEGTYWVSTVHGAGSVEVSDPLTHLAAQTRGAKGGRRRQTVKAYMPGRVVTLLVEEGQDVTAGQGVLVLEAMKMENEIRAEHDGTVTKVHVQPGQAVDLGNPLFELE
ncbi:MAG TPA: biotin/lipoyl-containing protein [Thermoanaerobaculia bacterium]|nr:biotin/lipoyl-containing protein [Thermoanaerobaculia bacterium]